MVTTRQKEVCVNISPTILDSFNFFKNAPKSWKRKAKDELILKINKIPFKPSAEIQFGLDFERELQRTLSEGKVASPGFKELMESPFVTKSSDLYRAAIWQQWTNSRILVDEIEVNLLGRIDCLLPDKIIDVKTTQNFRGETKYLSGMQHVVYCLTTRLSNFEYHVYEFLGKDLVNKHVVTYVAPSEAELVETITCSIKEFFAYLTTEKLFDVYTKNFCTNRNK